MSTSDAGPAQPAAPHPATTSLVPTDLLTLLAIVLIISGISFICMLISKLCFDTIDNRKVKRFLYSHRHPQRSQ